MQNNNSAYQYHFTIKTHVEGAVKMRNIHEVQSFSKKRRPKDSPQAHNGAEVLLSFFH